LTAGIRDQVAGIARRGIYAAPDLGAFFLSEIIIASAKHTAKQQNKILRHE
jgi:hypothetical protein